MLRKDKGNKEALGRVGRVEKENRYNNIIKFTTIGIVVAVVGILIFGGIWEFLIKPSQTIVTVDDVEIKTGEFQKQVRFERQRLVSTYYEYFNYYYLTLQTGGDPTNSIYASQMQYLQYQLQPSATGQSVMQRLIENVIIAREAEQMGIEVTDEEVQETIENLFGYYPDGEPTLTITPTTAPTSTLSAAQLALATLPPTVTPFPTATGAAPTATIFELVPTATSEPYTYDDYQTQFQEIMDGYKSEINYTEEDYVQLVHSELMRMKVYDAITEDLPRQQEQVWARHILVEDEDTAKVVLAKLESGADFSGLAADYSTDESNNQTGGDLGWFDKNTMVEEFSQAAFELGVGDISEPVETYFGWHIIQVLGHEDRPLSPAQYTDYRNQEFSNWLNEKVLAADIVYRENWMDRAPDKPDIPANLQLQ